MSINEWLGVISFGLTMLAGLWKLGLKLNTTLSNLTNKIETLNDNLTEGKRDRERLHSKLEKTDGRIDGHDTRITVLEDWRKGTQYEKH